MGIPPGGMAETYLSYGAEYDPSTNSWVALPTAGEPAARQSHTAVWTGNEMLIWGGTNGAPLADGATYLAGGWGAAIPATPAARQLHTAVWIGDPVARMIIWGGESPPVSLATGAMYDPGSGSWDAELPTAPSPRSWHTAVVAGTRMIVWGGNAPGGYTNTGAIFDTAAATTP
jgi:hypothetical protein